MIVLQECFHGKTCFKSTQEVALDSEDSDEQYQTRGVNIGESK